MGGAPELVERGVELAGIEAACDAARAGAGGVLLVEGPAGIGKSSLLASAAAAPAMRVLAARGSELERSLPLGVAGQLFSRLLARDEELARRVLTAGAAPAGPLLEGGAGAPDPVAARHAVTWLAANLADEQPLLLCIDDLQWADPGSLRWVEHLAHRLGDLSCLLLCAWRTGEPGVDEDALDRLRDAPATTVLRPVPLSAAGVAEVVRAEVPDSDERLWTECLRASGGNPFLVAELVRTLAAIPAVRPGDVAAVRPESVARSVARRLGRLSDGARGAAEACAVLGDGCELRDVAGLAGLSAEEAAAAVDELIAAGVVDALRPLRFVHPLVGHAVHDRIAPGARAAAHRRAARLLDAQGADPGRVAVHLLRAEPAADPWVSGRLEAAADAARARGAVDEAVAFLERADAEPPPADRRAPVDLALALAEHAAARRTGIVRLERIAVEGEDPADRARAALALAHEFVRGVPARTVDLLAAARRALPAAERVLALELAAEELALRAVLAPQDAGPVAELVALAQQADGDTHAGQGLLAAWSWWLAMEGASGATCAAVAERALSDGLSVAVSTSAAAGQAVLLLIATDREAVGGMLQRTVARGREQGLVRNVAHGLVGRCIWNQHRGSLREAEADGRSALAAVPGQPDMEAGAVVYLARVLADRGALDEADTLLARCLPLSDAPGFYAQSAFTALAHVRAAQGRWEEAAQAGLEIGRRQALAGAGHPALPWRIETAVALAVRGRRDQAERLLAEQRPRTVAWDVARQTAQLLRAEGLVEGGDAGLDRVRAAAAAFAAIPAPLEEARTRLELGAALRRGNARRAAREELRTALDLADRCGADRLADRAKEELAASGARPQRTRLNGVASLTASELRVARLAAEGLGNPEIAQSLFVSRKTVETHLGAVFRKLDIRSRDALAGVLAESG